MGKVGESQEDNTLAFRVYGLSQGLKDPYWRVQIFDTYQKGRWVNNLKGSQALPKGTGDVQYTVVLEPHYDDYLPALDYRDDHDDAQARAIGFRQLVGQRQSQK